LIEYLKGQPGYTDYLAAAGYVCGISGKWHLGDSHHAHKSHSFWEVHARGGGPYYNAPMIRDGEVYHEPRYVTDAITDSALRFLEVWTSSSVSSLPSKPTVWDPGSEPARTDPTLS